MNFPPLPATLIIGLGHKARNGKDAVADYIMRAFGRSQNIRRYAFADALKAHCRVAFGMTEKDGPLLQMVGTDLYRKNDMNIWVRALYWTIREHSPEVALITDMRFLNEAAFIKEQGGATVEVNRRNLDGTRYISPDRDATHASENALNGYDYDYTIEAASGDLDSLQADAAKIFLAAHRNFFTRQRLCALHGA
jgi:hypothetical protein